MIAVFWLPIIGICGNVGVNLACLQLQVLMMDTEVEIAVHLDGNRRTMNGLTPMFCSSDGSNQLNLKNNSDLRLSNFS